jgi:hypothetical protein
VLIPTSLEHKPTTQKTLICKAVVADNNNRLQAIKQSRHQASKQPSLPPMSSSFNERKKLVGKNQKTNLAMKTQKKSQFKKKKKDSKQEKKTVA